MPPPVPKQESPSSRAWLCVLTNTLAFPGLGTIMAKRAMGYPQAALTLAGFAVFVGFMCWFFAGLLRVASDYSGDLDQFQKMAWSRVWIAGVGLGLCLLAWIWALFSSMAILRAARQNQRTI